MDYLLVSVPVLVGLVIGFVVGKLTTIKRYNDSFYDFGFVSGYEACRLDLMEVKQKK